MHANPVHLADLPSRWARFCLGVESFVHKELHTEISGTTLLIPVSGGLDSTVLAHILFALRNHLNLNLHGIHIDHGLRKESGEDAAFAERLCAGLSMPCHIFHTNVARIAQRKGLGLEEAGRYMRYALYRTVAKRIGANWTVLAHHANDLAEDMLMRLLRGTGWPSLGGMPGCDTSRSILRPLLLTSKTTLRQMAEELGLEWREDASNNDPTFLRNRIRHELLPFFLKENPVFLRQVADLWRMARYDEEWFDENGLPLLHADSTNDSSLLIPEDALRKSTKAARLRAYKTVLESIPGSRSRSDLLFNLDNAVVAKHRNKTVQFPGPTQAVVTRQGVRFETKPKRSRRCVEIDTGDDQG